MQNTSIDSGPFVRMHESPDAPDAPDAETGARHRHAPRASARIVVGGAVLVAGAWAVSVPAVASSAGPWAAAAPSPLWRRAACPRRCVPRSNHREAVQASCACRRRAPRRWPPCWPRGTRTTRRSRRPTRCRGRACGGRHRGPCARRRGRRRRSMPPVTRWRCPDSPPRSPRPPPSSGCGSATRCPRSLSPTTTTSTCGCSSAMSRTRTACRWR